MAPNILLLVLDTARRDVLEPYGAPAGCTPALAQLARRGRALERAYATASWTLPSHASMFTGILARRLGLGQAPGGTPHSARGALEGASERMLTTTLRDAGYRTQGWSTNLWVSPQAGFDIGFDELRYISTGRHDRMHALLGGGVRSEVAWAREGLHADSDDGAEQVGAELRDAIGQWSGTPTFWFVNLSECHSPYLPPRPWNDMRSWERVIAALEAKRYLNFHSICLYAAGRHEISEAAFGRMRHLYRRAVSYMDHWLGGVLEALEQRGILDETLVIVTSDHGENFGEGGLIAHGFSVDERLVHVPLVMAGPGTPSPERVFSLAELPRLVSAAAGAPREDPVAEQLPEGVAIAQYDPLVAAEDPQTKEHARKWELDDEGIARLCARFSCATDGRLKLVMHDEQELLYDLDADPGEQAPLDPAGVNGSFAALRAALSHPAVASTAKRGAAAAPQTSEGAGASPQELEAIEQQMKLLGYM